MPSGDIGYGLLGVLQGIEKAQTRATDLQKSKDLLKLEQDKLKLMEKEIEQRGESSLYDAMSRYNQSRKVEFGNPGQVPTREGLPVGPAIPSAPSMDKRYTNVPEVGLVDLMPGEGLPPRVSIPAPKGKGDKQGSADMQLIEFMVSKLGETPQAAMDKVLKRDKATIIQSLTESLTKAAIISDPKTQIPAIFAEAEKIYEKYYGKQEEPNGKPKGIALPSSIMDLLPK